MVYTIDLIVSRDKLMMMLLRPVQYMPPPTIAEMSIHTTNPGSFVRQGSLNVIEK
jgi:hypothetical protein